MARRERYLIALECSNCGTKGAAEYKENETPPFHKGQLARDLIGVRGAFTISPGHNPEIFCAHCNTKVA
jgi:hypothetical protein